MRATLVMQRRLRARAVAILAACTVLCAGLLALRHETVVAHVRDHATGALHHAYELAEYHEQSATPHLHGRDVEAHEEAGSCALLAGLEQSTVLPSATRIVATQQAIVASDIAWIATAPAVAAVYRLAPKTSPPASAST